MYGVSRSAPRRLALVALASALSAGPLAAPAHAVPPATAAAVGSITERWLEHRVAPGERIAEIAELYHVTAAQLVRWNKLSEDRPVIRTGQQLRVLTSAPSQSRERHSYVVRRGDSWSTLAKRFEVTVGRLRDQWNRGVEELQHGKRIVVFRLPDPEEVALASDDGEVALATPAAALAVDVAPVIPAASGAQSVGRPDRGRIVNAAQVPINEGLYTLRNPDHSYGSSFAVGQLTLGLQRFRATGFDREIVIQDMSRKAGGRFRPHESHQSGRDVDIRLPLKRGVAPGTIPTAAAHVDWDATWQLVRALLSTEQVRFIFLSRARQRPLYEAALRAGASKQELSTLMQFPRKARTAVVRHARGHMKHLHVRFRCGPEESACIE